MLSTAKNFSRFYGLITAVALLSPSWLAIEVQAQTTSSNPLPKDWCGRLWGVTTTGSVIWDNPTNGVSSSSPPPNVAPIPPLPPGATPAGFNSPPGYATLAIHARSGTLYTIDRGSAILYQYNMGTGAGWQGTLLSNLPIVTNIATNFNKMTVTGDTLRITNSSSLIAYAYALDPATGTLASAASTAQTLTFDSNTLLPDGTRGNPPGATSIDGGDIAQDEYGDTYMLTYDNADSATQYAYFYKLVGSQWIFQDRVQKATNTDRFAGLAFYNDTIYVKGTAGRLSRLALTRVGNDYDWAGNNSILSVVGDSTGITDLASCGVPALNVTKAQTIYTDRASTIQATDQTKIVSGQYIRYTIAITNTGDAWARDSYLRDVLPAGVTYVPNSATDNGTNLPNAASYPFADRIVTSAGALAGQIRLPFSGNSNTATYTYLVKVNGTTPNVSNMAETGYLNPYPSDPANCNTGLNCGRTTLLDLNPSIFGTVWNDTNGSAANTFNNIFTTGEAGTNAGNNLYALLVNSTGNVVAAQAIASNGTYAFSGLNPSQTNLSIRLSTTAGTVGSPAPAAAIPTNWKNTSPTTLGALELATIDISNNDFGLSLPAGTILVKRITAINGQAINPHDGTVLNALVDSASTTNDDPARKWPTSYIKGAINGGIIRPGDTVEYTVYYLNDSGADTKALHICDPIRGQQTYVNGSVKMLPGGSTAAISLTDTVDPAVDRATHYLAGAAPTDCNASNSTASGRDNGGISIKITGTGSAIQPDLAVIPAATDGNTPASSYGSFTFTTKIDPSPQQGN